MRPSTRLKALLRKHHADTVRADGRLERTCEHGVGHPVWHVLDRPLREWEGIHGCCGPTCCFLKVKRGR